MVIPIKTFIMLPSLENQCTLQSKIYCYIEVIVWQSNVKNATFSLPINLLERLIRMQRTRIFFVKCRRKENTGRVFNKSRKRKLRRRITEGAGDPLFMKDSRKVFEDSDAEQEEKFIRQTGLLKDSLAMAYQRKAISKEHLGEKCGSIRRSSRLKQRWNSHKTISDL